MRHAQSTGTQHEADAPGRAEVRRFHEDPDILRKAARLEQRLSGAEGVARPHGIGPEDRAAVTAADRASPDTAPWRRQVDVGGIALEHSVRHDDRPVPRGHDNRLAGRVRPWAVSGRTAVMSA